MNPNGQGRVFASVLSPVVDGGYYAIRRVAGQWVQVQAQIICDGHDVIQGGLQFKHVGDKDWEEHRIWSYAEDRWQGKFQVDRQGNWEYRVVGWVDHGLSWREGLQKKAYDGQYVMTELKDGIPIFEAIQKHYKSNKEAKEILKKLINTINDEHQYEEGVRMALSNDVQHVLYTCPEKKFISYSKSFPLYVDRQRALFSAWYEFFPRSASETPGQHGTFKDCEKLLPRIKEMGFDVLYFPPIHPIGEVNRKGKNNATIAGEGDVGSPWGIGNKTGGHDTVHPELGTLEDYKDLIQKAKAIDIEIAMDFALQCAPDHPWVKEHPSWFKWRSDGTVQYAENPPKKYQDILPIYFETEDWRALWTEIYRVVRYWIEQGVTIFRVDNPHTKPFVFWEWLIAEIKKDYPDILFLSEAFTRAALMYHLGKIGFTQSYNYFPWKSSKHELIGYMNELTTGTTAEIFRPNFWPNTPDINTFPMQNGNPSLYMIRLFLAATLCSSYGIYGPVYELLVHEALPGKEEYYRSEKYEIYHWDWTKHNKVTMLITMLNKIRKEHPAFHQTNNWENVPIENEQMIAYYKESDDGSDKILCIVNLNPFERQTASLQAPIQKIGVHPGQNFIVHDLISENSWIWNQEWNYIALDPGMPFHLFKVRIV
ncbi:MAG: alpha-1,4-glucan--maltose-1-phosphate maltosyltransferase [Saprospiraceae bacterium]